MVPVYAFVMVLSFSRAFPLIPDPPLDGLILGLADRHELLAVQPFDLQRSELTLFARAPTLVIFAISSHYYRDTP